MASAPEGVGILFRRRVPGSSEIAKGDRFAPSTMKGSFDRIPPAHSAGAISSRLVLGRR